MSTVRKFETDMKKHNADALSKFGLSLGARLKAYLRIFGRRDDVIIYNWKRMKAGNVPMKNSFGIPLGNDKAKKLYESGDLPLDVVLFFTEIGELIFEWDFKDRVSAQTGLDRGANGGVIRMKNVRSLTWYDRPSWEDSADYIEYGVLEEIAPEGVAILAYVTDESRSGATVWFSNSNECSCTPIGNMETYITRGAKNCFGFYWQSGNTRIIKEVREKSISPDTPEDEIMERLMKNDASEQEARALISWLGKDITVLLPS